MHFQIFPKATEITATMHPLENDSTDTPPKSFRLNSVHSFIEEYIIQSESHSIAASTSYNNKRKEVKYGADKAERVESLKREDCLIGMGVLVFAI